MGHTLLENVTKINQLGFDYPILVTGVYMKVIGNKFMKHGYGIEIDTKSQTVYIGQFR